MLLYNIIFLSYIHTWTAGLLALLDEGEQDLKVCCHCTAMICCIHVHVTTKCTTCALLFFVEMISVTYIVIPYMYLHCVQV